MGVPSTPVMVSSIKSAISLSARPSKVTNASQETSAPSRATVWPIDKGASASASAPCWSDPFSGGGSLVRQRQAVRSAEGGVVAWLGALTDVLSNTAALESLTTSEGSHVLALEPMVGGCVVGDGGGCDVRT
jgi:hypothetical protein